MADDALYGTAVFYLDIYRNNLGHPSRHVDAIVPVIIIGLGVCLLRVVWIATVYKAHHTMLNVCLAYPISWIVTDVAFFFYYRRVKWLYHIK